MRRLIAAAVLAASAVLAGCEEPAPAEVETAQPPIEAAPAPVESAPAAEPEKAATPTDGSTLPPDQRASEETVKPESETLFY